MPPQIAKLPVDKHGYPVPWFVAWIDGLPDFRVIGTGRIQRAVQEGRCWICGRPRNSRSLSAFVIGPMCSVNRVSAEPPSHVDCATYSALVCPFLSTPNMRRREANLPEDASEPAGVMLKRNPGVTLVWITRSWRIEHVGRGLLWFVGHPLDVLAFAEGRPATREEVTASIESGLPALREIAEAEGLDAVEALNRQVSQASELLAGYLS